MPTTPRQFHTRVMSDAGRTTINADAPVPFPERTVVRVIEQERPFVTFGPMVEMAISVEYEAPVLDAIQVIRRDGDPPLTPAVLRKLPITTMYQQALAFISFWIGVPEYTGIDELNSRSHRAMAAQPRRKMTREFLEQVAKVYRSDTEGAPVQLVSDQFGIALRTATAWVAKARELGVLENGRDK